VVWGLAATSLLVLENEGMRSLTPAASRDRNGQYKDTKNPPIVGMDVWGATVCFTPSRRRR